MTNWLIHPVEYIEQERIAKSIDKKTFERRFERPFSVWEKHLKRKRLSDETVFRGAKAAGINLKKLAKATISRRFDTVSDLFEYHRIENGLTIDELTDKAGMSGRTYSQWVNHKVTPRLEFAEFVADALEIDIKEVHKFYLRPWDCYGNALYNIRRIRHRESIDGFCERVGASADTIMNAEIQHDKPSAYAMGVYQVAYMNDDEMTAIFTHFIKEMNRKKRELNG